LSSFAPPPLPAPSDVEALEERLSRPPENVIEVLRALDGDIVFLGVGGKMGPTMARMAQRAFALAGVRRRVIGVSRFRDPAVRQRLETWGIETCACDLLDHDAVSSLPAAPYVVSMSGFKFGTREDPEQTWATNCGIPVQVCPRYRDSRLVAFSTGNVYGPVLPASGGSRETDEPRPDGQYAMSALGRERIYAYFSRQQQTPTVILRLNYATELRYGVLVDLAQQISADQEIDVAMGFVNVIWLGDANAMTLLALQHATCPARILNLAGPDILATRDLADRLARRMGRPVRCVGAERPEALLSNGHLGYQFLGEPAVSAEHMICWTAEWIARRGPTLGKPTHFQTHTGQF
jgi:nucleoside-diphosphate-sugar epimerase